MVFSAPKKKPEWGFLLLFSYGGIVTVTLCMILMCMVESDI